VPFRRPEELAGDDSPEWLAWQHAVRTWREEGSGRAMDVLVSVPTTAPLRASADVEACIRLLRETGADAVITVTPAARSPWFNMVILDGDQASLVMRPERALHVRQAAPPVFDMTTVAYAARSRFVLEASSLFEGDLRAVVVPPERALDIDSELDLEIAEFLLQRSEGP
jgi:N-acylneuraminate cytidylyltransferase